MKPLPNRDTIKTLTTHYIDGAFVESHGREVMDIISPTNGKVIGRVTLGDEEDARRAIAAAKRVIAVWGCNLNSKRRKTGHEKSSVDLSRVKFRVCPVGNGI